MKTHTDTSEGIDLRYITPADRYPISCPASMKRMPLGLDQQGRHPEAAPAASEVDDEGARIGLGAFLPVFLALSLVGAGAAVVLLLPLLKGFPQ